MPADSKRQHVDAVRNEALLKTQRHHKVQERQHRHQENAQAWARTPIIGLLTGRVIHVDMCLTKHLYAKKVSLSL